MYKKKVPLTHGGERERNTIETSLANLTLNYLDWRGYFITVPGARAYSTRIFKNRRPTAVPTSAVFPVGCPSCMATRWRAPYAVGECHPSNSFYSDQRVAIINYRVLRGRDFTVYPINLNPLPTEISYFNFHLLEVVVGRYREPQLQVGDNYLYLSAPDFCKPWRFGQHYRLDRPIKLI